MNWEFCRSAREALSKHGEEGWEERSGWNRFEATKTLVETSIHCDSSRDQPQDGKRKAAEDDATGQKVQKC